MALVGQRATGAENRREIFYPPDYRAVKGEWMIGGEGPGHSPTVFLIEQPPSMTVPPHFHHNNQFQLFIDGHGKIGPRELRPTVVHYAGAYTAYGPIVAGPEGLKYFTVRTVNEIGGVLVEEAKGKWPAGPRRHATSKPLDPLPEEMLASLREPVETMIFAPAEDGLMAKRIALPPGSPLAAIDPGVGDGLFLFVLDGVLRARVGELGRWESLYLASGEAFPHLAAGEGGAALLALVTPGRDPAYC